MRQAYVYIMTNKPMGILYIGVTDNLPARIFAHRAGTGSKFCKKWKRIWKLRLISEANPEWDDLFDGLNA